MKLLRKINCSLLMVVIALAVLAFFYVTNQDKANKMLRIILEWDNLGISLWLAIFVCFFAYYLSVKDNSNEYSGLIYKHFGNFADSAFAVITYGLASTTSVSILKGVYIQQFFGDKVYFNNFSSIDIYSMLVVCLFLFGYSIWASSKALIQALYIGSSEKAEPVS